MDLIQSIEAIERVEMRHQDQLRQAERNQPARILRQWPTKPNNAVIYLIVHPLPLVAMVLLLMVALAVASI